ncbi:YdcF family protein [Niabella yanshanensis]|uniref:YdcF family protein n=1 Tax=Niabella yanshanensis TaxID=577386 RepID=A0ABZ0WC48_9BACT|nr:YdcF family protein [Niabella yanshanensis]WQD39287.1 YdcF family protein [Niabella yanshanensis]
MYRSAFLVILVTAFLLGCKTYIYRERPAKLYREVTDSNKTFDVAIVPGVPFYNNQWDSVMKGRVLWADFLYKKGIIRNVIFSGSAVYSPYYEARIMGLYAEELGIPAANIFFETQAEHSTENIYYSYEMARKQGFKTIALVTDPFQSLMMKGFTRRRFATSIWHVPFIVDTLRKLNGVELEINPSSAYEAKFRSIVDRENKLKRFRGTLGAFIPWENRTGRKADPL